MKNYTDVDTYIRDYPKNVQNILNKIRQVIQVAAPQAEEAVKYGIPTFMLNGRNLVHFGGFKNHIGFYPTPSGTIHFKKELSAYEGGKGSVQFPLDRPIPYTLIKKIVQFLAKDNALKSKKEKR